MENLERKFKKTYSVDTFTINGAKDVGITGASLQQALTFAGINTDREGKVSHITVDGMPHGLMIFRFADRKELTEKLVNCANAIFERYAQRALNCVYRDDSFDGMNEPRGSTFEKESGE
jgi:hypothetical protein